jgi:hypothetical protein
MLTPKKYFLRFSSFTLVINCLRMKSGNAFDSPFFRGVFLFLCFPLHLFLLSYCLDQRSPIQSSFRILKFFVDSENENIMQSYVT